MNRTIKPDDATTLRCFAKAYRAEARLEQDIEEMCALFRLARESERKALELEYERSSAPWG